MRKVNQTKLRTELENVHLPFLSCPVLEFLRPREPRSQGSCDFTHRCPQPVPGCLSGLTLLVAADFCVFHCSGNFLVRLLGPELDLMASGLQTRLRNTKLHGACPYDHVFPRHWGPLAERV